MRELFSGIAAVLTLAAVLIGSIRWLSRNEPHEESEFHSPEGRYSIRMPARTGRIEHCKKMNGGTEMIADIAKHGGDVYGVGFADFPAGISYNFDAFGTQVARAVGARSCRLTGGSGGRGPDDWRDFEIEGGKPNFTSGRLVFAGSRLYYIAVMSDSAGRNSPEVNRFVESFQVTGGSLWGMFDSFRPAESRP